jgi:hypothetical protein
LACRRLAWELAVQRRTGKDESPIPGDVLQSYPPEPERLFLDARGSSYLYYAAGQLEMATEALKRAQQYQSLQDNCVELWFEWILDRANHISAFSGDPNKGCDFINWVYRTLDLG